MVRRTHYCVQLYERKGRRLSSGKMRTVDYADMALRTGERMASKTAGVVVCSMEGDAEFDDWSTPVVMAKHGDLPAIKL